MTAAWSYGLAAVCFATLLAWRLRQPVTDLPQRLLLAAYAATAVWAALCAVNGVSTPTTLIAGTVRTLAWLSLLYALTRRATEDEAANPGLRFVFAAEALVIGLQLALNLFMLAGSPAPDLMERLTETSLLLRIVTASGALIIIHNIYGQASVASRMSIRLAMFALTLTWGYDLNLFTFAYLASPFADQLFVWRGVLVAGTMPLFALGGARGDGWRIRLSHAATFQTVSLLVIVAYLGVMTMLGSALQDSDRDWLRIMAVGAILLVSGGAIVMLPSARLRAWAKVKLAKHFFEHRYDYRSEWLRFTGTIGRSGPDAAPLGERVIKAFGDILEAPGGLLLVADDHGVIDVAASRNWPGKTLSDGTMTSAPDFWRAVESEGRIVDLDAHRHGSGANRDQHIDVPEWMSGDAAAWLAVPLIHHERLVGIILLAAPEYRRALDWEDFDLLRTAGRQAASSLAEAHGQEALLNAQRFEEFNRRFAFILHDVKNLVSQLSLLSRNAERHADNPEFRADMVATLKSSVGKMNDLLARLAPQGGQRRERAEPTPLRDLLSSAIAAKRRDHEVRLLGDTALWALVDPHGLEQAVGHLLQNAIDASPGREPVLVRVASEGDGIAISITDQGVGMDSDFIRNRLFQPFASTKADGFGVGAFEARSLIAAMGGRLTVTSTPGQGSSFTIHLIAAQPASASQPALIRKIA